MKKEMEQMLWMKDKLPSTTQRVAAHTCPEVNDTIRSSTLENLARMEDAGEPELTARINTLNKEWDMDRFTETKAALCILGCSLLGSSKSKGWSLISMITAAFLLQQALFGWCPSTHFARKMGIRTAEEISREKYVLKALRRDFSNVKPVNTERLFAATEKQ
jgi:hypothetical protein